MSTRSDVLEGGRPRSRPATAARPSARAGASSPIAPWADSAAKRALDAILAGLGLLLSAPLWLAAVAAVKLEDGGPVFYEQHRWGRDGRVFRVRKLRTMRPGADGGGPPAQAEARDPRVTRVGRVLRATGLDELPQLLSVLTGAMSLVGPRPLAVGEVVRDDDGTPLRYSEIPGFDERLAVRPGLTSPATLHLARDAAPARKFRHDVRYVREASLALDLRLVVLSVWTSLRAGWTASRRARTRPAPRRRPEAPSEPLTPERTGPS